MKIHFVVFAIVALSLCSYAQTKKVIEWPQSAPDQAYVSGQDGKNVATNLKAIEIVEIKVEGKTIAPGQPFLAGDDWLGTVAVRVKNVSDKSISSIRLYFGLPETRSPGGQNGFSLEYGKELSTGIDYGVQTPIEPGQEIVLMRSGKHYARDKEGIAKRTGIKDFSNVVIGVSQVKFGDGTLWSSYKLPLTSTSTSTARN